MAINQRIGFIGLGAMGEPMAANVAKAGFPLTVFDVRPEPLERLEGLGATVAVSARAVAEQSDVVLLAVVDDAQVEATLLDGGVLDALAPGAAVAVHSTIHPSTCRRLNALAAERHIGFLDAPISGGANGAEAGTLAIMVGGDARDFEEARPVLAAMGANIIHVGPVGAGEVAKLCNNLVAGVAAVAVSEAFRIAEGFGVDPKILTEVISKSSGNTWVMEHMHPVPGLVGKAPSSRDYAPGFTTDLMAKDLGLVVNAARELRVPVLVAPAAQQALRLASSHGFGRKDFSSIYMFLRASSRESPV